MSCGKREEEKSSQLTVIVSHIFHEAERAKALNDDADTILPSGDDQFEILRI